MVLTNFVSTNLFDVVFVEYASVNWPVNLVNVAATLLIPGCSIEKTMPARYET
uniref:Uncharacterized protein n=1 Tax=Pseudomonas syringae pv. actinidiae TaxID=103796 RepID=A0A2P0QEU2_PSESF|nr:hypothetical protein [Pseudomonas syringae pv. actinidiae]